MPTRKHIQTHAYNHRPHARTLLQKRLLITGVVGVVAAGLALIPTEAMRLRPSKPLYFYIVPLLRVKVGMSWC